MTTFPDARHVSVTIARAPADVYAFAREPRNLPRWARGLSASADVEVVDGALIVDSPMGRVTVRFVEPNRLGVLDHDVALPTGETVHNPMRVVANGDGSEVVFTLFRRPGVTDDALAADVAAVAADLAALAALLEQPGR